MLKRRLTIGAALIAVVVAASCAPRISSTDFVSGAGSTDAASWSLSDVEVVVSEAMKVNTNGNVRYPPAEQLVWWGDPPGDRKAQVAALMTDAAKAGAIDALAGTRPVNVRIEVTQFHAMTPRARATNLQLGVHEIKFDIAVVDVATGEVLAEETGVNADMRAFSGPQAVAAEQSGQGQKIRIQTRVAQVVRSWLTS